MGKTILVTGGAGFIGNCFCKLLLDERPEYRVINVDVCTYAANPHTIDEELKNPRYKFYKTDIRDRKAYPYSKDFFIPTLIEATYDPKIKKCEVVDKFMERVCCGDKEIENLIYEMIGYCLIPTSKFQKSFILYLSCLCNAPVFTHF